VGFRSKTTSEFEKRNKTEKREEDFKGNEPPGFGSKDAIDGIISGQSRIWIRRRKINGDERQGDQKKAHGRKDNGKNNELFTVHEGIPKPF